MDKGNAFAAVLIVAIIVLSAALLLTITRENGQHAGAGWTYTLNSAPGTFDRTAPKFVSDGEYLYAAAGKTIYSFGPQGMRWSLQPSGSDDGAFFDDSWNLAGAAAGDGRAYLLVYQGTASYPGIMPELLAVSDDGRALWTYPLQTTTGQAIAAGAGQTYLHGDDSETVIAGDGSVAWQLQDVNFAPAMDEAGDLYVMRSEEAGLPVEAYFPNGTLRWTVNLSDYTADAPALSTPLQDPVYGNGTVYVWLANGLLGLDPNGTVKWTKHFDDMRWYAPGGYGPDSNGCVYVSHTNLDNGKYSSYLSIIGPDGNETDVDDYMSHLGQADAIAGGIAYDTTNDAHDGNSSTDDSRLYNDRTGKWQISLDTPSLGYFENESVTAYDVRTAERLWTFYVPAGPASSAILNQSNVYGLIPVDADRAMEINKQPPAAWYAGVNLTEGTIKAIGSSTVKVYPGKDVLYVDYWAYDFEYPPFFGTANCTYTGGLFALDKDGRLLWSRPADSYIAGVEETNGTVFYATNDGRLSAVGTDIAAGLIIAALCLFLRFIAAGTVSRARSRVGRNENRNTVLRLVTAQPGSTLHEIVRGTGRNVGTVRYHLLILSLNHKITSYSDGSKFVRYFAGTGRYTDEEKLIIGLLRREPMRKMIVAMADGKERTNREIAVRTGLQESGVSKYLADAYGLGIIRKASVCGEKSTYSLSGKYVPVVARALKSTAPAVQAGENTLARQPAEKDEAVFS